MTPTKTNLQRWLDIGALLRWWGMGLFACLPPFLRRLLVPPSSRLVLSLQEDGRELVALREGRADELGRWMLHGDEVRGLPTMKRKAVVFRLPEKKILSRTVALPQAAENNLRQVVGFELDRLTPFTADKVYYDARVIARQPETKRITVKLSAIPRKALDPLLEALARMQVVPSVVDAAGEPGINLLPQERKPRHGAGTQRLQGVLAGLVLVALVAAAFLPLWQLRALVIDLIPRVDTAQSRAEVVYRLREELEKAVASHQFLQEKHRQSVSALRLLNEFTRILPDGTWLEQLDLRGDEVQLRGQSREASSLIAVVESSALFQDVTFRSPVIADRRTGRDRFHLAAQINKESP
jgi:general secretion pathway protein L